MVTRDEDAKRRNRKPVGERRVTIGFSTDTYERILDLADSKGVSVAQVVRDAVAGHLERLKIGRKASL